MTQPIQFGIKLNVEGNKESAGRINEVTSATAKMGDTAEAVAQQMAAAQHQLGNATAQMAASQGKANEGMRAADEHVKKVGVSAAQTAAALRGIPAQMTDIFTSLASGQAPITVLLQQGGQLKDMFGGLGPAVAGVGRYLAGLLNPVTLIAGAVAALAVAYYQGSKEADAYARAIIMTGNATGVTVNQLGDMAKAVSKNIGTQAQAAEALTQLAGTGQVAAGNLQYFTEVAIRMEKTVGQSVADTAKDFAELGKAPVAASEKLNDAYHYLTPAIYEQIKALQDQGKTEEAAALAQKTYADAFNARTQELTANLGLIERGWNNIVEAAKKGWDTMLNVGRKETNVDLSAALSQKIAAEQAKIDRLKSAGGGFLAQFGISQAEKNIADMRQAQAILQENMRLEQRSAEAKAAANQQDEARIKWLKEGNQYLSRQAQRDKEIAQARELGMQAGLDEAQIEIRVGEIRKKYSDIYNDGVDSQIEAIRRRGQIEDETSSRSLAQLQADKQLGLITEETYINEVAKKELAAFDSKRARLVEELAMTKGKANNLKDQKALIGQIELLDTQRYSRTIKLANDLAIEEHKAYQTAAENYAKRIDTLSDETSKLLEQIEAQKQYNDKIGLSKAEIDKADAARLDYLASLKDEKAELADLEDMSGRMGAQYREQAKALRELADLKRTGAVKQAAHDSAEEAAKEWKRSFDDVSRSLTDAIMRGGKNAGEYLRDYFRTLVLRPIVQAIVTPVAGAVASIFSPSAAAGTPGINLGSSYDLVSAGKTMWDGFSSGFEVFSAKIGTNLMKAGDYFGSDTLVQFGRGMTGTTGGGTAMTLGNAANTAISWAGPIMIGQGVGRAISGGYSAIGGQSGSTAVNAGTLIGAYLGGPIGAGIGAVVGGLFNRAFGMGPKETQRFGIEGDFASTGFVGRNYADWHQDGGWFRGDDNGTDYSALDATMVKTFSSSVDALKKQTSDMAKSLGLSAASIEGYSKHIRLDLTHDQAQNQKIITDLFTSIGEELTAKVGTFSEFSKAGETASATMQRLSVSLTTANTWLSLFRQRLLQVSLAGGDAASKLADAFGGLDNLNSAAATFYETYYSDGERAARSAEEMAKALESVNLSMPSTKDELRNLADSLDLNTDSGRKAYAVLLSIAPEFANVVNYTAQAAQATAENLISAFTADGTLDTTLDTIALGVSELADSLGATSTEVGYISRLFLDAQSGLISFNAAAEDATPLLTDAQAAAQQLNDEMDTLHYNATNASLDIAGLGDALANVNIETFVDTMALVFQNLGERLKEVIGNIADERGAVREAALQIINPTVMSKDAIQSGIDGINTALPGNTDLLTALGTLDKAKRAQDDLDAAKKKVVDTYAGTVDSYLSKYNTARNAAQDDLNSFKSLLSTYGKYSNYYTVDENFDTGTKFSAHNYYTVGDQTAQNNSTYAAYSKEFDAARSALKEYNKYKTAYDTELGKIAEKQKTVTADIDKATEAAKQAQLDYADALQEFAIDASKSVSKLSRLREETVKYYEAQKQLADLMTNSAAGLRGTVAQIKYNQLTPEQQFEELQTQYATAYAMALSTDGETLAGYGDKLNNLLNPLLDKAREVYGSGTDYNSFASTAIARAEAIASRLEDLTPTDYAADSLAMLEQIDSTLAALDESSRSAEQLIVEAIDASRDQTVGGLRAVVAALTGQTIPAFATGGDHFGGYRIVGENGPELEATGPARIFNATQTRAILSGGSGNTERLEALLLALLEHNANMSTELRGILINTGMAARHFHRVEREGVLVYTDADTPLQMEAV